MGMKVYEWLVAGAPIVIYGIAWIVWRIKTNDLPHIDARLANLEGRKRSK